MASRDNSEVILLTRFRLSSVFTETVLRRHAGKIVYYDPHATLHGPFFLLLVAALGRQHLESLIAVLARILRLPLCSVPHGQRVPGYAGLQMAAANDAMFYLDELWRDSNYRPNDPLPPGALEGREAISLHLKFVGVRVWQLIENVRVLRRSLGDRCAISVRLNRRLWPETALHRLERTEDVRIVDEGARPELLDLLCAGFLVLARFLPALAQWRTRRSDAPRPQYAVATEILDPHALQGRPAEPNYIVGDDLAPGDVLFYIQPDRRGFFSGDLTNLLPGSPVVDLSRLPLAGTDVAFLTRGYWNVLRAAAREGQPLLVILTHVNYVRKYALLAALFTQCDIVSHVYHAYPQGRAAWRHDSGLVTAACRGHNVHSLSYQTRAHFGLAVELCFDCFDTYCFWGDWWRATYRDRLFATHVPIIGDVFLDDYDLGRTHGAGNDGLKIKTVVLFPCDIDYDEPTYLTLDYTVEFLTEVTKAVGRLNRQLGGARYRVVVKPKHPEHVEILENNSRLSAVRREENVEFAYVSRRIHGMAEAVRMADYALSLLPTTPGIDVLLTGTPSAYFNRLEWGHARFDEHPLIVRSADEIEAFLSGRRQVDPAFLDSLDPWRDGNSRARVCAVINHIVETARGRAATTAAKRTA